MNRNAVSFVSERIGRPYDIRSANCWHLVAEAQAALYGRAVPTFSARTAAKRTTRTAAAASTPDGWAEAAAPQDGAVVLLSRPGAAPDVHAGTMILLPHGLFCLHTDHPHGVVLDSDADLHARGWDVRRYFVPAS